MAHYFIGIHLPEELQHIYTDWQQQLKLKLPYKKWTHPGDLHITLKFLGEVDEEKFALLQEKLSGIVMPEPIEIELESLGFFGNGARPRVLMVDVTPNEKLVNLQKQVEEATIQTGFSKENRAYRPHMTLAKKWASDSDLGDEVITELQHVFTNKKQFTLSKISLFQIHPKQLPSYEVVAVYPLHKKG